MNSIGRFTKSKAANAISASAPQALGESYRSITTTRVATVLVVVASAFAAFFVGRVIGMFLGILGIRWTLYNERWITWNDPQQNAC